MIGIVILLISSANRANVISKEKIRDFGPLIKILMGFQYLSLKALSISLESLSIIMMKR